MNNQPITTPTRSYKRETRKSTRRHLLYKVFNKSTEFHSQATPETLSAFGKFFGLGQNSTQRRVGTEITRTGHFEIAGLASRARTKCERNEYMKNANEEERATYESVHRTTSLLPPRVSGGLQTQRDIQNMVFQVALTPNSYILAFIYRRKRPQFFLIFTKLFLQCGRRSARESESKPL